MAEFSRIYKTELSDRQLMAFWALVQASGRDRSIGYDRPAMDGPAFCRFLRRPSVHPWLLAWRGRPLALYYLTDRQGRSAQVHFCFLPCGTRRIHVPADAVPTLALRQGREQGKAERGEALESGAQGNMGDARPRERTVRLPLMRAAALYGLASLLWEGAEQGFRLDTLIGITPESNAPALALVRSLGAREHGTVPGLCWLDEASVNVPGVVTTFNREVVPQRAARL